MKINECKFAITKSGVENGRGWVSGLFRWSMMPGEIREIIESGSFDAYVLLFYDTAGQNCMGQFKVTEFTWPDPRDDVSEFSCHLESIGDPEPATWETLLIRKRNA